MSNDNFSLTEYSTNVLLPLICSGVDQRQTPFRAFWICMARKQVRVVNTLSPCDFEDCSSRAFCFSPPATLSLVQCQARIPMWVEFYGSLLCSERLFSFASFFCHSLKTTILLVPFNISSLIFINSPFSRTLFVAWHTWGRLTSSAVS